MLVLATLPLLELTDPGWVRVEDPAHPEAVARSGRASLLARPPAAGVAWRWASLPAIDGEVIPAGSEALALSRADTWHDAGFTGEGVRIALFDLGWSTEAVDLDRFRDVPTQDCFASRTCEVPFDPLALPARPSAGPHGWACAEVIRELAPGAELHLVRVNALTTLENAVRWAIRNDIDIVSMSMSFYNDSFYDGTGPHADLMLDLEAAGVLMVTSAGNGALQHWSGTYSEHPIPLALTRDASLFVSWDQFDRCGTTDLDVVVRNASGLVVGHGADEQRADADRCEPVERVSVVVDEPQELHVEIRRRRGPTTGLGVSVIARGGTILTPTPGSVTDPAAHPLAVAVGAVSADGYLTRAREAYSSFGPTHSGHPKPDIVGPDRLSTRAYGPGGFAGTSASAPVVAALVALVRSRDPALTNREAFTTLQAWSHADPPLGLADEAELGAGRARLPRLDSPPTSCASTLPVRYGAWLIVVGLLRRRRIG